MRGKNVIYYYLSGIILALMLLHLYVFTKSVALKYEITHLKIKYREIKNVNRVLASKLAYEEALPKIESRANALNMYYPEKVEYITLSKEAK